MEFRSSDTSELRTTSDQIRNINEKLEKRAHYQYNRAQTLTMYHLLYQIILFYSLATSSSVRCNQRWIPLTLSVIPAILYFAALLSALTGYDQIKRELDMYSIELKRIEDDENKTDVVLRVDDGHVIRPDGFVEFKRRFFIWTTVLAMVGFNGVVLVSSRRVCWRS